MCLTHAFRLPAESWAGDNGPMTSNIEPLAREMAMRICRRSGMPEADILRWVDLHWPCAAAMLEAGVMDEGGDWVADKDVRLGMEAYRERLLRPK
jgi:hypothetical protein